MRKGNKSFWRVIVPFICFLIVNFVPSGCSSDVGLEVRDPCKFKKEFQDSMEFSDIDDVTQALFHMDVGQLNVSYHDSSTAIVKAKYSVATTSEFDLAKIPEEMEISVKDNGGVLKLGINKKDSKESICEWLNKNISRYSISADIQILLPKKIQNFDIKVGVGGIKVDGLQGGFRLESSTGSIEASDIRFTGDSTIVSDVGDISLSLNKKELDKSEVEISAGSGNIEIDVGSLPYEDISNTLPSSNKAILISNKCTIKSTSDLGKVIVR